MNLAQKIEETIFAVVRYTAGGTAGLKGGLDISSATNKILEDIDQELASLTNLAAVAKLRQLLKRPRGRSSND